MEYILNLSLEPNSLFILPRFNIFLYPFITINQTKGTGISKGGLATQVTELELITAGQPPSAVRCSSQPNENKELFDAAIVSIGALGIISEVTLKVEPLFRLQWVF